MNLARWICLLGLLIVAPLAFGVSSIYTVTGTGSGGACTANSTTDPNCTLDAAIYTAANGDTVRFAPGVQGQTICGTYPNGTYQNTPPSVTIDGAPNGVKLDSCGGGPIFSFDSGTLVLSHLTLQNSPNNAIYDTGATLTIDSCAFVNNSTSSPSDANGGAVVQVLGSVLIVNSTFVGNSASGNGGAIYANGNVVIGNSTITGNSAGTGGGVGGYGITIMSSIIAGNSATNSPDVYIFSSPVSLGYNIIGNSSGSGLTATTGDQFGVDPLFAIAGLTNNGGPTQSVALQSQSSARSGGNCAGNNGSNGYAVIPAVTLDQRGYTRTSAGTIGCTAGAFDMTSVFYNGFE